MSNICDVFQSISLRNDISTNEIRIKIHLKTDNLISILTEDDGFARRTKIY